MTATLLLLAALFGAPQSAHRPQEAKTYPLRNTFVTAAETVIDTAATIDLKAEDAVTDGQMQQLRTSRDTLVAMAQDSGDEQEKDAAAAANDLVFTVTACRLQARNGSPSDRCAVQIAHARTRAMDAIRKHKTGTAWVDGAPQAN